MVKYLTQMPPSDKSTHGTSTDATLQDISVGDIDPARLASKLQGLFGTDKFEVYMRHTVYSIRAPRSLSQDEIAECNVLGAASCGEGSQSRPPVKRKWPMAIRALWSTRI